MAKLKKFGTFSGVFTPSILTILGVIMYLRFPTIIGQAGLINTIGIIIIAHIISITTSLSVASLSTDKTVKTGGTYFMISRSLGLPIGGTLGLALFVGLSFSVSLYLIGFAESFLTYWNLDTSINSVRITGTIILIVVTTITFISTSLAIKSQYFIMAAIFLSLLSIFFGHHEFTPKEIHLQPLADAAPFMLLFGIFFPAVTGFEAGVSMSGDLKDAKKSLPVGAMAAVGVGFVVYIGLALFYSLTVDAEALMNDPQILFKISLVPALVIIGIWGATLSSALGSILGAPRILQAIAMDKIAPKIFAKGTGKTLEPRNALLLAFVIAEAGILIGQLDVIARIVSMFFITTYAFLNLACAIESWSSSDFRPAFKIPRFVSILGAVSAFIVMILLDFIALAGAVIVLGLLLFYLSRKELVLETGDAWSSFWTNLAKRSLLKLSNEKTENRNWRPNIILFRGKKQERMHLVELGLAMSGKLGALTDYELIFDGSSKSEPVGNQKKTKEDVQYFSRYLTCDSVENGIKSVTSIYGFSGFEPNTVMMGWSRDTKNTGLLATILSDLKKKNLNAVFLDYDKQNGFGKKENIDIWWNGKGQLLSFALNLMRFILLDSEWIDANLRILIINSDNKITDKLYRNTKALLDEKRINAEVIIISDDFGTRSKTMIINNESAEADLIVLGISPNPASYTEQYIDAFNRVSDLPSSMLVLSPSNEFEEINLIDSVKKPGIVEVAAKVTQDLKPLPAIENKLVLHRMEKLDEEMMDFTDIFIERTINEAAVLQLSLVENFKDYFEFNIKNTELLLSNQQGLQLTKSINKNHQSFLSFAAGFFDEKCDQALIEITEVLDSGIKSVKTKIGNYIFESPETMVVPAIKGKNKKEKNISVPFRKMISHSIYSKLLPGILNHLLTFEKNTAKLYSELKNITLKTNDIYEKRTIDNIAFEADLQIEKQQIQNNFNELEALLKNQVTNCRLDLFNAVRNQVIEIGNDSLAPDARKKINSKLRVRVQPVIENIEEFPDNWKSNSQIFNNAAQLDCLVLSEQKIIYSIVQTFTDKVDSIVSENVLAPADVILKNIDDWLSKKSMVLKNIKFTESLQARIKFQETYLKISEIIERLPEEIEISSFSYSDNDAKNVPENSAAVNVNPYKIARYYIDTRLYDPFYREMEQLDKFVKQSIIEFREANSLLKFRLENVQRESVNNSFSDSDFTGFLNSIKKQVSIEKNKLTEAIDRIKYKADEMVKNAISPLYSHSIIEAQNKISTLLRDQKGKKFSIVFSKNIDLLKGKANALVVSLLYSSSAGVIQAKKYLSKNVDAKVGIRQILDVAETEMPEPKVFSQIPVFYRTLFSSKSLINDDLWVPMENETALIKSALQRHKSGLGGAVLITGAHGAGKTALTRYCSNHFFKKDRIFTINAPAGGSVKTEDWLAQLRSATGMNGDSYEILRNMPHESTIIINDLELWWERTNEGTVVLMEIIDLVRVYGRKIFFIINSNSYSFNQINKVFPLEDNLLSVVECHPFDAKKLQQLIQRRHKTSGLTYYYKNIAEESVSQVTTASLFNGYFSYSNGNPGVTMNAWLGNITKIEKQDIFIEKPELPDYDVLNNINTDWLIIIALFIQHKFMNTAKLARVMGISNEEAEKSIYNLSNAKILELRDNEVYMLGRYLEPFFVKICREKGII